MNEPGDPLDPPQRTNPLEPVTAPPSDSAEASMPAIEHYVREAGISPWFPASTQRACSCFSRGSSESSG